MKALIAGGGIGGVTAALCLLDAGIDVELYERSSVFNEVGAGIQISPNGVKVLERLGLRDALEAVAFRPEALEMRTGPGGMRIFSIPMRDEAVRRYGAPYYHVHRADLMSILSKALRAARAPNAVHMDKEVQGYAQIGDSVTLTFADNTRVQGDVLIGADGIHSFVRQTLFPNEGPALWNVDSQTDWAGVTLSLKNLFGTLPGICYGWPKNELHWRGVPNSIVDIACTCTPHLAIVDGIVGMEGDGPLNGTAKPLGAMVMGTDLVAVDATCCRLMKLPPERVPTLVLAAEKRLGHLAADTIQQLGESIASLATAFELPPGVEKQLMPEPAKA